MAQNGSCARPPVAPEMQIMYGLAGERRLTELELPWLDGYENSRPVRIGNGAYSQFQLDIFGELMDAIYVARKYRIETDSRRLAAPNGLDRVHRQALEGA